MAREAMERAAQQALRAGQIIRRLREFVARGESERQIENLAAPDRGGERAGACRGARNWRACLFRSRPAVDIRPRSKIQIQQVLLNLMRNAVEAMQEIERRELTVSTHKKTMRP